MRKTIMPNNYSQLRVCILSGRNTATGGKIRSTLERVCYSVSNKKYHHFNSKDQEVRGAMNVDKQCPSEGLQKVKCCTSSFPQHLHKGKI